jgi:hypothetical protein
MPQVPFKKETEMAQYSQDIKDRIGPPGNERYILYQIGPVWAIEQPQIDDPSYWSFFDQVGAEKQWTKLQKVKRDASSNG